MFWKKKRKLKLKEVRLNGSAYTLEPVANELNVAPRAAILLLRAINVHCKEDENAYIPESISVEDVKRCHMANEKFLIIEGLVTNGKCAWDTEVSEDTELILTSKAKKLLLKTALKQKTHK